MRSACDTFSRWAASSRTRCITSILSVEAEITDRMSSMPRRLSWHTLAAWPCLTRKQRERSSRAVTTLNSDSVSFRPSM
ncbi:hypothetical protein D9M72_634750 [compost metagenome]